MRTNRTAIDQLTPQRADARIIRHTPPRMPAPPRRPTPSAARSSPSIRPTSSKSSNVPVGAAWPLDFCLLWLLADAEFRRIRGLLYNHNACIVLERRAAIDAEISEKHSTPAQRRFDAHQCVLGFWGRRGARGGSGQNMSTRHDRAANSTEPWGAQCSDTLLSQLKFRSRRPFIGACSSGRHSHAIPLLLRREPPKLSH
jgi:hypothetical protein